VINALLLNWTLGEFKVFLLVLVRVASLLFMMPVFSGRAVPNTIKVLMAMVLALMLTPMVPFKPSEFPSQPLALVILIVSEVFIGASLALIMQLIFVGVQIAGQMIGFQMGFSVASVMDPNTGVQSVLMAQLSYLIALMIFLAINGHYYFIKVLFESYKLLPPGHFVATTTLYDIVMQCAEKMFILGVKLMAPVMTVLLLAQVALGILAKTVPQVNLLIISFSLTIGLGLFFLGLTLQFFWPVFEKDLVMALRWLPVALKSMAVSP